ncbi:MAG: hypothetical protein QOC81_3962 [Thermoanaerobaculia bacterium]|nr:hypothetical protein [Thermoanaerobaculia bacterium]
MPAKLPPVWSDEQLDTDRLLAKGLFREERMREPLKAYLDQFKDAQAAFEDLLTTSADLTQLSEKAIDIVCNKRLLTALRYLPGPPVSADDLKVLTETSLAPKHLRANPDLALKIVDTILVGLDCQRFPWMSPGQQREATAEERASAILASAAVFATRRVETIRRNLGKQDQEQKVKDTLAEVGFKPVRIKKIDHLSKAPQPGEFCGETQLGTRKADIVVGLWDLRTMAIECKVSNSAVNSIKRLNNDAEAKAKTWRNNFGTQVVPSAVLGGVYDLINLQHAQENDLSLFWGHDLAKLVAWIETTRL